MDVSKERTRNYLRQLKGSVVFKAVAMLASFLAIPLMIRYLGQEQFGVWSTLLTVMSWIVFCDLGVGNGLRNKVAEALAKNDKDKAAAYIASGYGLIGSIALGLWGVIAVAAFFVQWQVVFNTKEIQESVLRATVQTASFFVVLNFWIGLIGSLLGAVQKTSLIAFGQLVTNVLALLLVFVLTKTTGASIKYLAFVYGFSMVFSNLILSFLFFRRHPELCSIPRLDKKKIGPLLSTGLRFFILQVAVLVIFTTDKILITHIFGPQYVTQYEVVFKVFSVITFAHTIITAPLWSAYTDAFHREDFGWIGRMLRKQIMIFGVVVIAVILTVVLAKSLIALWIGSELHVSMPLVIAVGMFVLVSTWNNIYAMFVNGIGRITIQLYTAVVAMVVNIPLALVFTKCFGLGLSGIVLATCASLLFSAVALPIQCRLIVGDARRKRVLNV